MPPAGSRVQVDQIDLADTALYTGGDPHLAWQTLRAECPVFWQQQRDGGPGFWAVTRWADVRRVLSQHEEFSSEQGTAIAMLGTPDPAAGLMMQSTDPPRHGQFRREFGRPFAPHAVPAYAGEVRSFARAAIEPALDGEIWDIAAAFARLPMVIGARLMGLPEEDIDLLLRLAYASLAPEDPHYRAGPGAASPRVNSALAHYDIINYFTRQIAQRQATPSDDLISHLMTAEVAGHRLTDTELLLNCLSLLLGAVVTTSHALSATILTLAEQHGGVGRWPPEVPVQTAVAEFLRWSSPVTHFMRSARHDTEMHGVRIRAGDAVTAWIASANRDETVFDRPYALDLSRSPNRHIAFGSGPHRCLGSHLAQLMLRESLAELISRVECFELAGVPCHLVSNEIAGIVSLPLRMKARSRRW